LIRENDLVPVSRFSLGTFGKCGDRILIARFSAADETRVNAADRFPAPRSGEDHSNRISKDVSPRRTYIGLKSTRGPQSLRSTPTTTESVDGSSSIAAARSGLSLSRVVLSWRSKNGVSASFCTRMLSCCGFRRYTCTLDPFEYSGSFRSCSHA